MSRSAAMPLTVTEAVLCVTEVYATNRSTVLTCHMSPTRLRTTVNHFGPSSHLSTTSTVGTNVVSERMQRYVWPHPSSATPSSRLRRTDHRVEPGTGICDPTPPSPPVAALATSPTSTTGAATTHTADLGPERVRLVWNELPPRLPPDFGMLEKLHNLLRKLYLNRRRSSLTCGANIFNKKREASGLPVFTFKEMLAPGRV